MAILPDFDEFLLVSSKLDYLYRCNRYPCIDSQILMKLKEIHRNQAILPLHSESGALGPQRAGVRQRVKTGIVGVGLRLNLYK